MRVDDLLRDPHALAERLVGCTARDIHRLHRAAEWLPERVHDQFEPPLRDEVLAALRYDLPLATGFRLHRAGSPADVWQVLTAVPPWVREELVWLLLREPTSAEARLLSGPFGSP